MTVTEQLVMNVLDTNFEDFDSDTLRYAKIRITDTIGALLGGINSSGADMIFELIKSWGGSKESSILGTHQKVPATNAALVMGIMARSNDMDPAGGPSIKGRKSPGHYSATSVPTAIAITEELGLGGRDLISAIILGDDLASRIGAAGGGPFDIGWEPSGTCSRFGAAVIAGKLMGLDRNQMLNALGIVLTQVGGTMLSVYDYTHSFKLSQGLAGWNGIVSAELAKRGFTGPKEPLMGRFGYYQQFCRDVSEEVLTDDLGKIFYGDEEFKLYPCCRGNASPVEAALKLINENNINPDHISKIQVDLGKHMEGSFLTQPFEPGTCAQAAAILNVSYNLANVILRKGAKLEHYTDKAVSDPRIRELISKMVINPTVSGKRFFCEITVSLGDGQEFSVTSNDIPRGDYRLSPLTRDEIESKFMSSVDHSEAISLKQAEKALHLLNRLETLDSLNELIKTLVPD